MTSYYVSCSISHTGHCGHQHADQDDATRCAQDIVRSGGPIRTIAHVAIIDGRRYTSGA